MYARYIRRHKIANLINVLVFMVVISGISVLYGKVQILQVQADERLADRARLLQHEEDLHMAQKTIASLTGELEVLRAEMQAQRDANAALDARLRAALERLDADQK